MKSNVKGYLGLVAGALAVIVLLADRTIAQGTGLIVATLGAGAGWLFKDIIESQRTLLTICQAYAAVIEALFEELNDSLSDDELTRFISLSSRIANGSEPEAMGFRPPDPFALLPDIRAHLHLLSPDTVRFLSKWRARGTDLVLIYDKLGTKEFSMMGTERLEKWLEWLKKYRDEFRDIGYTALLCLRKDAPNVNIDVSLHEQNGASSLI